MNKSVITSLSPRECELIASGKQTMLVRKTRPKIETPFKCYIYCSGGRGKQVTRNGNNIELFRWNGVRLIKQKTDDGWVEDRPYQTWNVLLDYGFTHQLHDGDYELNGKVIGSFVCDEIIEDKRGENADVFSKFALLSLDEQKNYGKNKPLYGWHISDLKIYDKPKELGEFRKEGFMTEEQWLYALYPNTHCHYEAWAKRFEIKRPPQSWVYCEPIEEE